jgi:hypothetical protein
MYKEYRFPITDEPKARHKQMELQKTYGVKIPAYKIEKPTGEQFFALVYPVGLQPKKRNQP